MKYVLLIESFCKSAAGHLIWNLMAVKFLAMNAASRDPLCHRINSIFFFNDCFIHITATNMNVTGCVQFLQELYAIAWNDCNFPLLSFWRESFRIGVYRERPLASRRTDEDGRRPIRRHRTNRVRFYYTPCQCHGVVRWRHGHFWLVLVISSAGFAITLWNNCIHLPRCTFI